MTDKELLNDIAKLQQKPLFPFWGFLFALGSVLYGEFIVRVNGYLLANTEPYFQMIPEDLIGWLMIAGAVIKLAGVLLNNGTLKRVGIISLSAMWSGVFVLATTYSFGTGYPHPSYIFMGVMMLGCFRIARKGDFG